MSWDINDIRQEFCGECGRKYDEHPWDGKCMRCEDHEIF